MPRLAHTGLGGQQETLDDPEDIKEDIIDYFVALFASRHVSTRDRQKLHDSVSPFQQDFTNFADFTRDMPRLSRGHCFPHLHIFITSTFKIFWVLFLTTFTITPFSSSNQQALLGRPAGPLPPISPQPTGSCWQGGRRMCVPASAASPTPSPGSPGWPRGHKVRHRPRKTGSGSIEARFGDVRRRLGRGRAASRLKPPLKTSFHTVGQGPHFWFSVAGL